MLTATACTLVHKREIINTACFVQIHCNFGSVSKDSYNLHADDTMLFLFIKFSLYFLNSAF